MRKIVLATAITIGLAFGGSAFGCTGEDFDGGFGNVEVNSPDSGFPRLSGWCSMKTTGMGYLYKNTLTNDTTFMGRFYVYPESLHTVPYEVFVALSDETNVVFSILYDGTNFILDAASSGGGIATAPGVPTQWNLVEYLWKSGEQGGLWVNSNASTEVASDTYASGTGVINQIILGVTNGTDSEIAYFDELVAKRAGGFPEPKLMGDANADEAVNSGDVISIINEFFGAGLSSGTPDCNLDGNVNSGDVICIINTFFTQ